MRPVQPILIVLLIGIVVVYFSRLRSGVLDRLVVLLFAMAGIVMAAVPDLTTRLAGLAGVGRGADLFMYFALLGFGFLGLVLYSKLRDLEASITELARSIAVERATAPGVEWDADGRRGAKSPAS